MAVLPEHPDRQSQSRAYSNPPDRTAGFLFSFHASGAAVRVGDERTPAVWDGAKLLVLTFGGTSVADADAIRRAAAIVGGQRGPRVVVVSALAGVTAGLLAVADLAYADERRALSALDALVARHHEVARTIEQPARRQA
ncbi:MAG: hypothetical protein HOQ29_14900, partial [Acidobacteria bacterium]|nr:hypothetical protein [Acidobacteriota bacterium]